MILRFIIFPGIAILTLAISNVPIYYALVKFFSIENEASKKLLFYTLPLLSISFILTSAIVHKFDNFFTRSLYRASSFWLGFIVCLLLFSLLGIFIYFTFNILQISINLSLFAYSILTLSIALFIFSYLNALHPIIKNIEVSIKNLPNAWEGKTIVQLSDIHLGVIHGKKYMDYISKEVNKINPDLVLITGDLFDGTGDNIENSILPINKIKSKYGIYYITGNHETYLGLDKSLDALKNTKIKHLSYNSVNLDGLEIIGIDYPRMGEEISLNEIFEKIKKDSPKIVMVHEPIKIDYFKKMGVNLQLSGHTHNGQMFPFNFITSIIYKGYDYGLQTDGDYNIYTSNGAGTWGPPLRNIRPSEIVAIELKTK